LLDTSTTGLRRRIFKARTRYHNGDRIARGLTNFPLVKGVPHRITRAAAYSKAERVWDQLTIPSETIGVSETASYITDSVQEPGIDGLARTNLRFS